MLIKANLGGWEAHRRTRDLVLSFASRVARDLGCHISTPPAMATNICFDIVMRVLFNFSQVLIYNLV